MLNWFVNTFLIIGVYVFVGYMFYSVFKSVIDRFRPREPPIMDTGGIDYE